MAGIIAQKIPPIIPPKIIKGKINQASKGYKANPILPLNNAPIIYCPSAPIFQIFALKPKDKPSAIRINGAALITNWGLEYSEKVGLIIGSQNINLIASNGFLPILKNKKPPKIDAGTFQKVQNKSMLNKAKKYSQGEYPKIGGGNRPTLNTSKGDTPVKTEVSDTMKKGIDKMFKDTKNPIKKVKKKFQI